MKKIFSIIAIALIGVFVMSSCEKEYETEPLKTVKISGSVKAWFDLSQDVLENGFTNVPQGTRIIFRIKSEDLCQTTESGYEYKTLQYETTVDNNGKYSIELPCVNFDQVKVEITPVDFKSNQKSKEYTVDPNTGNTVTLIKDEEIVFRGKNDASDYGFSVNIREGGVFYKNLYYMTDNDPGSAGYPF